MKGAVEPRLGLGYGDIGAGNEVAELLGVYAVLKPDPSGGDRVLRDFTFALRRHRLFAAIRGIKALGGPN